MNKNTLKTILILGITAIMVSAMVLLYISWIEQRGPEKKLLDDKVLIVFNGIPNEITPITNVSTFYYLYQSYYAINAAALKTLPPVLYKYHTIILLDKVDDQEVKDHSNVIYLYSENKCTDWKFEPMSNGIKINCDPSDLITSDKRLQEYIQNYIELSYKEIEGETIIPNIEKLK